MMKRAELLPIPDELVMNKIYLIREQKVMLDSDLAELYGVETKRLKESVRRNVNRFPEDFMFELTDLEMNSLRSQIASSKNGRGGVRYSPMAFTEQGVAMLSSVLNSEKAIIVNIQIIRIFTRIRKMLSDNTEIRLIAEELRTKTANNTKNIEVVFQYLDELLDKKENTQERNRIGYKLPQT